MKNKLMLSCCSLLAAASVSEGKVHPRQPDIILILADDLGIGDLTCYNPEGKIPTPNIDNLADNGVSFTDAHSTSALSTPSRYSVMTGRYPWRTTLKQGVLGGFSGPLIEEGRPTVASVLSNAGYLTACIGKWHLGWNWGLDSEGKVDFRLPITDGPVERGFDYYFGISASLDMAPFIFVENDRAIESETRTFEKGTGLHLFHGGIGGKSFKPEECLPELTRRAVEHIATWKGSDRPHFLYLPLTAPHTPCLPGEEFKGRTGLGDYGDFVVMVDDVVGQIADAVKKAGRKKNTVIIFTSDNGCAPYADTKSLEAAGHFPSMGYRGYKSDIFEGGHRIPLVISGKGIRFKGETCRETVTLADLFATLQAMAGIDDSRHTAEDSFNLLPYINGDGPCRDFVVMASGKGDLAIRDRQHKLIFTSGSGGWSYPNKPKDLVGLPDRQLYDLINDPAETRNLIDEESLQEKVKEMTVLLRNAIINGRTADGPESENDTSPYWKQTGPIMDTKR